MELFSLLAKLTLDSKEYEKEINSIQNKPVTLPDATIGLEKSDDFDSTIEEINSTTVDGPQDPDIGLTHEQMDTDIEGIDNTTVDGPDDPDIGLTHEEMDTDIGEINSTTVEGPQDPDLGLDIKPFEDQLHEGEADASIFGDSLGGIFSELSGILTATGIVAAVAGIVGSLKEGVELAKNTGDAIHKQSAFMGLTTKAYQEWDYALNLSGASITDLTRGMRNFQQIMAGDVTDKQADALERLGINMDEVTDAEDLMTKSMYALADYTGSDKDWIAKQLFGNNYTKFARLLEAGSKGIKEMREDAEGLGYVMTDEEIQNAADYMDATTRLDKAIEGLKTSLVKDILPILTDITNRIAYIVAFFSGRTGDTSFADGLKETNKELALEMANAEGTGQAAMEMVDKLYAMGDAQKLNAEQQKEWKETAEWLIEKIPSLSEYIDADTLSINGNRDAIKSNIDEWKALVKQRALAQAKEKKYAEFMEKNQDAVDKQASARAAEFLVTEKQNAAIAVANSLLKDNAELRERLGYSEIDLNGNVHDQLRSVQAHLQDINWDQYELMHEAYYAYDSAVMDAEEARKEYEKVKKDLEESQEAYDAWVVAIDEMYEEAEEEEKAARKEAEEYARTLNNIPRNVHTTLEREYVDINPRPFAIGTNYVPYDNYPALLHRGEQVLTATEVRRNNNQGQISTDFENRVIAAIREGMADANVTAIVTDRQVARGSNRFNGNELDSRRFVP